MAQHQNQIQIKTKKGKRLQNILKQMKNQHHSRMYHDMLA